MTVALSPHKVSKALRLYFTGLSQTVIGEKLRVDQSTVSLYATRFRERVAEVGIYAAAQEVNVQDEVSGLRNLAVELAKLKMTTVDALQGLSILKKFIKFNVEPEKHQLLISVCSKVGDPCFVQAAIKICSEEARIGRSYEKTMALYSQVTKELPEYEATLKRLRAELAGLNSDITNNKARITSLKSQVDKVSNEAQASISSWENEVQAKAKQAKVATQEIKAVSKLKSELAKQGLDIATIIKLAEEFGYGKKH